MVDSGTLSEGLFYDIRFKDLYSLGTQKGDISVEFIPSTNTLYNVFLAAAKEEGYQEQDTCKCPKLSLLFEIISPFTNREEVWILLGVRGESFQAIQLDFTTIFARRLREDIEENCADSLAIAPSVARYCFDRFDENMNWF